MTELENDTSKTQLHEVFSVRATTEPDVYVVDVRLTDMTGEEHRCEYVSRPTDTFGLNPAIRQWLADNAGQYEIESYVPSVVSAPASVSARQFKLQLHAAGLLDQVEAWVAVQDKAVEIAYANSGSFVRTEPMMQAGFAALGFTPAEIDAFFAAAAEL